MTDADLDRLVAAVARRVDWARERLITEPPGDAQTWLRRYEMDCAALLHALAVVRRDALLDASQAGDVAS